MLPTPGLLLDVLLGLAGRRKSCRVQAVWGTPAQGREAGLSPPAEPGEAVALAEVHSWAVALLLGS